MTISTSKGSRYGIILMAGLALACGGLGLATYQEQGAVEQLRTEENELQAKLEAANRRVAALSVMNTKAAEAMDAQDNGMNGASTPAERTAAEAKAVSKRIMNANEMAALVHNTGMQKLMASQLAAMTQMTYGDLMNHLQLSPEERDYLQKLLMERQMNLQNLGMQLTNPGLSADERSAIQQQLGAAWNDGETKIKDFINSDSDYAYYESYFQQEPEREEIGMLEASQTGADSLDLTTADALATMQNDARKSYPFTVDFYNKQNWANPQVINQTAVNKFLDEQTQFQAQVAQQAASILTPAQLDAYKQNQLAVRQMMKMQLNSIVQLSGGG